MVAPIAAKFAGASAYQNQSARFGRAAMVNGRDPLNGMPKTRLHARQGGVEDNTIGAMEGVGSIGDTAFNAEFFLPMGGWLGRNTLGRIPGRVGNAVKYNVGGIFNAPVEALKNISWENLFKAGALKDQYHLAWADYNKTKVGSYGKDWLERAASTVSKEAGMASKMVGTGIVPWIAKRSVLGSLLVGGFTLASGALAARLFSNTKHTLDDFQEVVQDLEGRRVSEFDLVNHPEKLTPMVQEIRSNLITQLTPDAVGALGQGMLNQSLAMMGGAGASAGAAAGAAAATVKNTGFLGKILGGSGGGLGMGLMLGGVMLPMSAESIRPNEHFLRSYLEIKDAQNAGQEVPAEIYADLISAASADVRGHGGPNSRIAQQLAQMYAGEGASARDIVIEVAAKEPFLARMKQAAEALNAQDKREKKDKPQQETKTEDKPSTKAAGFVRQGKGVNEPERVGGIGI